jgi:hypothetical protein
LMFPVCVMGVNMGLKTVRKYFDGRGRVPVERGYAA